MAYSDYGGYAFRNGGRIENRSDAVLSPEGIKSTPGQWPGWTIPEGRGGGSFHVLLGDGPIFAGLYKQSSLTIHRLGEELNLADLLASPGEGAVSTYGDSRYINTDHFITLGEPATFEVDGHRVEAHWTIEDNHYQYVRLIQPDGVVWTGFSGYGVGAGLEDCGYGFSSDERAETLQRFWPPLPPSRGGT